MKKLLEKNRQLINRELYNAEKRRFYSPATYASYKKLIPILKEYSQGNLLDIGCGDMPFKFAVIEKVIEYDSLDVEERTDGVTYIGNIQDMHMIDDEKYDTAIAIEVLEHIPNPFKAAEEMYRILKPEGFAILSMPHLSRIHEAPFDFYRYTKYGIRSVLENAGFEIIEIKPVAGLFSFLGHQFSTFFVLLFWHIPIVKWIVYFINKWLVVKPCVFIDKFIDKSKIFASEYVCVAKKIGEN